MNIFKVWLLQVLTKCSKKACTGALNTSNHSFQQARARLTLTALSEQELQAIFDLVIAHGYYLGENGSDYMCIALARAYEKGVTTYAEYKCAVDLIHLYILGSYALEVHLLCKKLNASKTARMAIYQNWSARP